MVLSLYFTEMHRTDHGYMHSGMRLTVGILGSVTYDDSNSFCRAQPDNTINNHNFSAPSIRTNFINL